MGSRDNGGVEPIGTFRRIGCGALHVERAGELLAAGGVRIDEHGDAAAAHTAGRREVPQLGDRAAADDREAKVTRHRISPASHARQGSAARPLPPVSGGEGCQFGSGSAHTFLRAQLTADAQVAPDVPELVGVEKRVLPPNDRPDPAPGEVSEVEVDVRRRPEQQDDIPRFAHRAHVGGNQFT